MMLADIIPAGAIAIYDQMAMLAVSGVGGAYFRAVIYPEPNWKRRVAQGIAGAMSAIFLGGLLAHIIDSAIKAGLYSYMAAGFLMGTGGEVAVSAIQRRFLK